MTDPEVRSRLMQLGEDTYTRKESEVEMKERLKPMERKRHLIIWGDNSTLLNHGHLLLMVNSVYDEACLESLDIKITTSNGVEVTDRGMTLGKNLRLKSRKGEMLDMPAVVAMQESTKTLQFLFLDLTLLSE